jgi:hypothetical protein
VPKVRQEPKDEPKQRTLFEIGALRVVVRPESPGSFIVVGPRLPGEPRRTRKSFTAEEARPREADCGRGHIAARATRPGFR